MFFIPSMSARLMTGDADLLPCTPAGIQQLLIRSGVKIDGAEVVVVGRSNIVGKPIANILLQKNKGANATVTLCHTHTLDVAFHTRYADILIVAAGRPKYITADMVKEGAVVIDVGVNQIGTSKSGKTHSGRRCRLRKCKRKSFNDHPGAGRRRTDDDYYVDVKYPESC